MAGKIEKNCWRHDIVAGLRDAVTLGDFEKHDSARYTDWWPILDCAILGRHDYVGPFFIACDHGCYHGNGTHGVGEAYSYPCGTMAPPRHTTMTLCLDAIRSADVVFAWLDSADCYGTLVELGYASALGKHIWIALKDGVNLSELWFCQHIRTSKVLAEYDNAKTAFLETYHDEGPLTEAMLMADRGILSR